MLGICGGYQMLGPSVADPEGIEGPAGEVEGLGLLDVETVLTGDKTLRDGRGRARRRRRAVSRLRDACRPDDGPGLRPAAAALRRRAARRRDLRERPVIAGAYVHGLFADDRQRAAWLASLGARSELAYEATVERTLDELAEHLAAHLDLDALLNACAMSAAPASASAWIDAGRADRG